MRRPIWRAAAGAGGAVAMAVALAVVAPLAEARSLQVEDLLQREGLGAVTIAPGGRWLLVEQRGPFASAARFDFQELNRLFRTRIMVADLTDGGPLRELFPPDPMTGYQLGPMSPDGGRAVVYRLTGERWELGIATLASGEVRWTGLTPEAGGVPRKVQWTPDGALLAIVLPPGAWPFDIRVYRPQAESPSLWAAAARGDAAVSVMTSGTHAPRRPADASRIVRIPRTGAVETLATGGFIDLELAPSGRRLALLEAADDIPLVGGRPVHGPYGLATRRVRLRLLDLANGTLATPCPGCDVLDSLLSWRADADDLLVYARDDGAAWTEGRLMRVNTSSNRAVAVDAGLAAHLVLRPERVAAGWLGADPILFGRPAGSGRDDWFRLAPGGSPRLTGSLGRPPREVIVSGDGLLAAADAAAWRIDRNGRARRLTTGAFTRTPRRSEDLVERTVDGAVRAQPLTGVELFGERPVVRVFGDGPRSLAGDRIPAAGVLLAVAPHGALLDLTMGGGEERLVWRPTGGPDRVLATLNRRLADVEQPAPIAITHPGPDGQPLRSWLYLPPRQGGPLPPLVVVPYPERTYAGPPARFWRDVPISPAAPLLGRGYAVLLPSLPSAAQNAGPADRLGERVLAIVDAAGRQPGVAGRFDRKRLALWGHSFGGYAVTTIIGQTDRFRAAIAVAPATDLISRHGQFGAGRRVFAQDVVPTSWSAGWVETLQGDMRGPPWEVPDRYLRNSPLMAAGRIRTPLLLAYGEIDGSHAGQAEELFSALYRQDKDAVLLAYWGEGHLFGSPGNLRDLYRRAFAFLDLHLGPVGSDVGLIPDAAPRQPRPEPVSASSGPRPPPPPPR